MVTKIRIFLKNTAFKYDVRSIIFLEFAGGVILSCTLLFLFLFVCGAVLGHETTSLDSSISQYVYTMRQPWLTSVMMSISLLGEQVLFIQAIIVIVILTLRRHKKETLVFLILLVIGLTVTSFLKTSFKVPRPQGFALIKIDSYSFPSGHAVNSFLFYGTLSYFAYHFTKNKLISSIVFFVSFTLVCLVGVSRVYLGVHRPSDVIAGYIVGFWLLVTVILIDKTITYFRLVKEPKNS